MKKINLVVMTFVMTMFANCSNDDIQSESYNELKVVFSVANKDGFDNDTRAVKTDWENGDEILIALEGPSDFGWYSISGHNCMKLKKTADGWTTDISNLNLNLLENGRSFIACYYHGAVGCGNWTNNRSGDFYLSGYKGGEILTAEGINKGKYIYIGTTFDLGIIQLSRNPRDFQISIKNLASAEKPDGTWKFYILDSNNDAADGFDHLAAGKELISNGSFASLTTNYSTGINYGGDVVFYFANYNSTETSLKFKLTDGTDTYVYETTNIPQGGKAYYLPAITDTKWAKE